MTGKVGERSPDQVIAENGYDIQLAFYKWALEKMLNEKVDKQYIYFLTGGELQECNWQGDPLNIFSDIASKMDEFGESKERLRDIASMRKEGLGCRFCGYYNNVCI